MFTTWASNLDSLSVWMRFAILVVVIWDLTWKGLALWRAASVRHEVGWFIVILATNTFGFVPIVYLLATNKSKRLGAKKS
ncbi:MAG: hypothetical protein H6797_03505 [Candidatus Nomurabacteria bacterium]|nr:MAG: hypothetical protein H6797_03505 [Candidatus Nomurabacteria bacterium]